MVVDNGRWSVNKNEINKYYSKKEYWGGLANLEGEVRLGVSVS
jgi:hypothetical protein